jgi:hypothetical protein
VTDFIDIQESGADRVAAGLTKTLDATAPIRSVMQPLGQQWVQTVQAETTVGRGPKPGTTRAAYHLQEHYSAAAASLHLTNTVPWMQYLLDGRGPISAKNARMLRFVIDGKVYFRKRVGPAKANDIVGRTMQRMQGAIDDAPAKIAEAIVKESGL